MSGISSYFRHTPTQQIEHNFDDLESGVQRQAPAVGDRLHRVGQSLLGISGQLLSDSMSKPAIHAFARCHGRAWRAAANHLWRPDFCSGTSAHARVPRDAAGARRRSQMGRCSARKA
ncbi:hypothetical protein PL963_P400036 (plasmid) [Pseudomonas cerasi]|uniref:Uncharacterized protein n=1 Tax=Pseudomonas cerasi TaxID=1583341 RepID=A0A2K4W3F4_9PSED|nr:hypothetical protein [Pseudomonas cerasi]SOS30408.1 hypothetical protein PL963_P400036 [Pseudomonas cerasi]